MSSVAGVAGFATPALFMYPVRTVAVLDRVTFLRDTLRGTWPGTRDRVRIPLAQIRSIQAKVPDRAKTALLAAALGAATVSALYFGFISQAGSHPEGINCGLDEFGDQIIAC